jgi:hypothetical protein
MMIAQQSLSMRKLAVMQAARSTLCLMSAVCAMVMVLHLVRATAMATCWTVRIYVAAALNWMRVACATPMQMGFFGGQQAKHTTNVLEATCLQ